MRVERRDLCHPALKAFSQGLLPGELVLPGTLGRLGRGVQLQVVGALDPAQGRVIAL